MFVRYVSVFLTLSLLIAGLAYVKYGQIQGSIAMFSKPMPAPAVSATKVTATRWEPTLGSVGTLQSVQGVMVSNQVSGQVKEIAFESGQEVRAGEVLLQLDDDVDRADLEGLMAAERLADIKLERNRALLKDRAVSRGDFDETTAQLDQVRAQVKAKQALIDKKTLRAPFAGRLGIRQVNLGQFLPAGSDIVLLEALDPLYVDYALPERHLDKLRVGQPVTLRVASSPGRTFEGTIAAISPGIDRGTRNISLRARLGNSDLALRPGMFARVETLLPAEEQVLTLPREAITFNTYGDSVFLIQEKEGKTVVQRRQVKTGAVRGDEVAVLEGLEPGDRVVSAGHVKLNNGQEVAIKEDAPESAPASADAATDGEAAAQ